MSELVIGAATVVGFRYDLYDGSAERIESDRRADPAPFLFGDRSVRATLQEALRGKRTGEDLFMTIPHGQVYGRRYPDRARRVSVKRSDGARGAKFHPGQRVGRRGDDGPGGHHR